MKQSNIFALVAFALGIVLLFFAWRGSNAPVDQMAEAMTGRFTGNTMWLMIAGIIGVLAGGGVFVRGLMRA